MKLMGKKAFQVHKTLSNFQFSAVGLDSLDGSEYTVVQILVDASSSVSTFRCDLEKAITQVLASCKSSPRSENLLVRVAAFSSEFQDSIEEIHGFTTLDIIDPARYDNCIKPQGCTPLNDAALSALESLDRFAGSLADQDYLVNGILFVITDGYENASRNTNAKVIKKALNKIHKDEKLESVQAILIGVDDNGVNQELQNFQTNAGFDEYISMGNINPSKLAKLAQWVSRSISATSQALGTGTASRKKR